MDLQCDLYALPWCFQDDVWRFMTLHFMLTIIITHLSILSLCVLPVKFLRVNGGILIMFIFLLVSLIMHVEHPWKEASVNAGKLYCLDREDTARTKTKPQRIIGAQRGDSASCDMACALAHAELWG